MTDPLRIALITLGDPNTLTGGYLYHRRMADLAPRFDARIVFVSFPERPFPLAVSDARSVLRQAGRLHARVLLLDSICAAFLGPWLVRNDPPVPLVGMLHQPPGGIDFGPPRAAVQAWLDRLAYRRAHRLLVASEHLAEQLRRSGFPPQRIEVVPPGRDVAPASGPPAGDLRRGRRAAFLCVGNWVERKGILDLLDAFDALPDDAAILHLAGNEDVEPAYAARVRRRLARPDLVGRVVRHGALPVEGVAALYTAADVFVLPSRKEPYGTVYGEAMAYGLPVIGWRAGNLPYLAEHEREGLIVPTGDIAALTGAMRRLVEDAEFRRRLGDAARARALTRPTWEASAGLLFDALRRVVGT
jgi:glycosyltransferase involved in cell wall biosynthesis